MSQLQRDLIQQQLLEAPAPQARSSFASFLAENWILGVLLGFAVLTFFFALKQGKDWDWIVLSMIVVILIVLYLMFKALAAHDADVEIQRVRLEQYAASQDWARNNYVQIIQNVQYNEVNISQTGRNAVTNVGNAQTYVDEREMEQTNKDYHAALMLLKWALEHPSQSGEKPWAFRNQQVIPDHGDWHRVLVKYWNASGMAAHAELGGKRAKLLVSGFAEGRDALDAHLQRQGWRSERHNGQLVRWVKQ